MARRPVTAAVSAASRRNIRKAQITRFRTRQLRQARQLRTRG